ncbi:MAG: hypothetical protein DWI21_07545 [Planctomycetota bacterium]|nr:MAG: hypothetical protein DWI21_07545 [Planctomycetota bacterium]
MTHVGRDSSALSVHFCRCRQRNFVAAVALFVGIGLSGCVSRDVYQAEELPPQLQAPTVTNTKKLDLSGLTTVTYNNDIIDNGDILEVQILVGLNTKDNPPVMQPRVNEAGAISLPNIGEVPVRGLDLPTAESAIAAACIQRGIYRSPQVTVAMKKQRTNQIRVIGAVKNQGIYNLPRGSSDLFSAFVAAGGLADDAGTMVDVRNPSAPNTTPLDRIASGFGNSADFAQIGHSQDTPVEARNTSSTFRVDLVSATKGAGGSYNLQDGATVNVERRDPEAIRVVGLVNKPNRYEYPVGEELRVLDAIALANGTSNRAANKIFIVRQLPSQQQPAVIQTSIREAKRNGDMNLKLAPGDIVSIEQTPTTVLLDSIMLIRFGVGASLGTFF